MWCEQKVITEILIYSLMHSNDQNHQTFVELLLVNVLLFLDKFYDFAGIEFVFFNEISELNSVLREGIYRRNFESIGCSQRTKTFSVMNNQILFQLIFGPSKSFLSVTYLAVRPSDLWLKLYSHIKRSQIQSSLYDFSCNNRSVTEQMSNNIAEAVEWFTDAVPWSRFLFSLSSSRWIVYIKKIIFQFATVNHRKYKLPLRISCPQKELNNRWWTFSSYFLFRSSLNNKL